MSTTINESATGLQAAETLLALAESEVAVRKAEADVQAKQAEHSAIVQNLADAQHRHADIFNTAVVQASQGLSPKNLADYTTAQTAVDVYTRIEEHFRCFQLADANVSHLTAAVAYRAATLAAERARRDARESEIVSDLSRVRTAGAPLDVDLKNLLAPHDRLILAAERELQFAQETLATAERETLAAKRAYLERQQ